MNVKDMSVDEMKISTLTIVDYLKTLVEMF